LLTNERLTIRLHNLTVLVNREIKGIGIRRSDHRRDPMTATVEGPWWLVGSDERLEPFVLVVLQSSGRSNELGLHSFEPQLALVEKSE
jgi:hypothetical protein